MNSPKKILLLLAALMLLAGCVATEEKIYSETTQTANKPEREDWFIDQALGMSIHWSVDS